MFFDGFDFFKLIEHGFVVFKLLEIGKLHAVVYETVAYAFNEKICELGVCLAEPPSVCYAVCNVGELFGREIVVIFKYGFLIISLCSAATPFTL